jgi:MATE family multidrug resistance protein
MNVARPSLGAEMRDTLKLAGPIVLAQVGHMSMGLVDTLIAGRISTIALAGLGLAANCFWTFTHVCVACMFALDTFFSQSVGAKNDRALARYFSQAFWLCGVLMVAAFIVIWAGATIYLHLAPTSATTEVFKTYIDYIIWCIPSLFIFFLLTRYWQAQHRVVAFMLMLVGGNVLNLLACFALGLGYWGFPRLEIKGIALATIISRYAMLAAAIVYTWWRLKPKAVKIPAFDKVSQREFFRLGLPAAGHAGLEVGSFSIVTFVIGFIGAVPLAAHHVTLIMAAFSFMFPVGFSSAAAVRVGIFVGAMQPERARLAGWLCISFAIVIMALFGVTYLVMPRVLLGWFSGDAAVIAVGVKLLLVAALFQVADGIQVTTTGALRGLGNTRLAMIANLIGHYPIGLAIGLVLAFPFGMGAVGLWTGLAFGLGAVAAILLIMWWRMTRDLAKMRPLHPSQPELNVV